MEIMEAGNHGAEGAVFVVVVGGHRVELPWVEFASLREGILVLEAEAAGSGTAAVTWVRNWDQASWQISLGEEASAPRGRRVKEPSPEAQ
jgi:hypothetical protein